MDDHLKTAVRQAFARSIEVGMSDTGAGPEMPTANIAVDRFAAELEAHGYALVRKRSGEPVFGAQGKRVYRLPTTTPDGTGMRMGFPVVDVNPDIMAAESVAKWVARALDAYAATHGEP